MQNEDDIIHLLDPAVRQHIESDFARYAPLLALLDAWKTAIDSHLSQVEENMAVRLLQRVYPQGDWRFPAQIVVTPNDLLNREVSSETVFTDRATNTPWTPTGPGWTLPSAVDSWRIERKGWDYAALILDLRFESTRPDARLLEPPSPPEDPVGQTQLAYVDGPEGLVAGLAAAPWAIQDATAPFEPVAVTRYEGYLDLEKGLGAARQTQRHLAPWLPPCHPYSRKFLRFSLPAPPEAAPGSDWEWLGAGSGLRLAALLAPELADRVEAHSEQPVWLNAIPLAQMKAWSAPLEANVHAVGEAYRVPFAGVRSCFAATARELRDSGSGPVPSYLPAGLTLQPGSDPRGEAGLRDVYVSCDRPAGDERNVQVRIYYDCLGGQASEPAVVTRPQGHRFQVLGAMAPGASCPVVDPDGDGSRHFWYHGMLRSPLLTHADIVEVLSQHAACRTFLNLEPDRVTLQLDVVNDPWVERTAWDSYLWPSMVGGAALLEERTTYLTASRIPVLPVMRIWLEPKADAPAGILSDVARHAASVVSQHFMVGWYRIEGHIQGQ